MDIEFLTAMHRADQWINRGWTVFQTWHCKCGTQQTMSVANHFYLSGRCEECNEVTDLVKSGCGFHAAMLGEEEQ